MNEEEVIDILKRESDEFRRLYREHRELDDRLSELNKKHYLNQDDELEMSRMKKEKLHKKDKIAEMIREYRKSAGSTI